MYTQCDNTEVVIGEEFIHFWFIDLRQKILKIFQALIDIPSPSLSIYVKNI